MQELENRIISLSLFDQPPLNIYELEKKLILSPISKINLFIGQNNAGKSRFLREIFISREIQFKLEKLNTENLKDILTRYIDDLKNNVFIENVTEVGLVTLATFNNFKGMVEEHYSIGKDFYSEFYGLLKRTSEIPNGSISTSGSQPLRDFEFYYRNLREISKTYLEELESTNFKLFAPKQIRRIYIPILRGMRPFKANNTNFYYDRTQNDYFPANKKEENDFLIFTGLELYDDLKAKILGEPEDRDAIENFQVFLSKNFFNGKRITLIPKDKTDTVNIKIGEEQQLPIYSLGDGLQNLLIIFYNIILQKTQTLFFIEEPDIEMHPGLQRMFIEQMLKIPQHQFFITTHSNHLLDLTLDYSEISVFHFSKEITNKNVKFNVNHKSSFDRILLQDLGVKNSSVFLSNCTIWVEGITDRSYLRFYLNKYFQEKFITNSIYKEDIDYSFVEYQGSNIKHWSFDKGELENEKIKTAFLMGNPMVIADGDIEKRKERTKRLFEELKENFVILNCKEIENMIPEKYLKKYIELKHKDEFDDINKINFNEYYKKEIGLGTYLDSLKKQDSKRKFGEDSGTIKNKISFCNEIIDLMDKDTEWVMPEHISKLCEKIFAHIQKNKN